MKRRSFLAGLLLAPWAAVMTAGAFLQSCGSDAITEALCTGEAAISMDGGHFHPACIPQSVIDAPQPSNVITLELANGHTHTLTLTDAEVAAIAGGSTLTYPSSVNGHQHNVRFN